MQIDISNLPPEVESLHKLIATLHDKNNHLLEQNNDWALKYRDLSKQNTTLSSQNTSLINEYKNLSTENTDLSRENSSLVNKCTQLADDNSKLSEQNSELLNRINKREEQLSRLKAERFGKSSEKLERKIDILLRPLNIKHYVQHKRPVFS